MAKILSLKTLYLLNFVGVFGTGLGIAFFPAMLLDPLGLKGDQASADWRGGPAAEAIRPAAAAAFCGIGLTSLLAVYLRPWSEETSPAEYRPITVATVFYHLTVLTPVIFGLRDFTYMWLPILFHHASLFLFMLPYCFEDEQVGRKIRKGA